MTTDRRSDELISRWLEEAAPNRAPERILDATFARTRVRRQQSGWRAWMARLFAPQPLLSLGGTGSTQLALSAGGTLAILLTGTLALATLFARPGVVPLGVPPLPLTADAWTRVLIEGIPGTHTVEEVTAGPNGLLARVEGVDAVRLATSTDGLTWSVVPESRHPPIQGYIAATDEGFLYIGGDVWASADGRDWRLLVGMGEASQLGLDRVLRFAAGGPGIVAVGADRTAWTSADGSDWARAAVPPPPTDLFARQGFATPAVHLIGVDAAGDRLLAHGFATSERADGAYLELPVLWTSADGRSWTDVPSPPMESIDVLAGGAAGFAVIDLHESGAVVWHSLDGRTWEAAESDAFASRWRPAGGGAPRNEEGDPVRLDLVSLTGSPAGFMAVGNDGICESEGPCASVEAVIWTSRDGRTWARQPPGDLFTDAWADDPTPWGDRFLVGGQASGQPAIWLTGAK